MNISFGLQPDNQRTTSYWGARAIIAKGVIDIPWDRKCWIGEENDDFCFWINNTAMPVVERSVKRRETKGEVISEPTGLFTLRWNDNDSGGYLYIGAWVNEALI